ncbi:MAG: hypothetical protein D4R67_07670 [Bacteroidetes bacterium]|nr:MAG: hypothetical protein D4R67_07670 [Bacteroidota bacterium]
MKKIVFVIVGLTLLGYQDAGFSSTKGNGEAAFGKDRSAEQSLFIQSTPDVYPLASAWVRGYAASHPEVNLEVARIKGYPAEDKVMAGTDLFFVSGETVGSLDKGVWKIIVGKEAIVPVIHARNPFLTDLNKRGVTREALVQLVVQPGKDTWGTLLGNAQPARVHLYIVDDGALRSTVAGYLGTDAGALNVIQVGSGAELVSAIRNDPYGIGFCRLTDAIGQDNKGMADQIRFLPIDKNRNGKLDSFENIYRNPASFTRGVWIGKYPSGLTRTIYAVSGSKPTREADVTFLTWILTGGQQVLDPVGYRDLAYSDRQVQRLSMLENNQPSLGMLVNSGFLTNKLHGLSIFSIIVIALIPIILVIMIYNAVVRHRREKELVVTETASLVSGVFNTATLEAPGGLYFDKTHTWAFMEKNGSVRIGIDDFMQHVTGPFTKVRMKHAGEKVKKGDPLFSIIQSGKQLTIHSPVSGTIKAQNNLLETDSSLLNSAPYADGWVYMIEPVNWAREISFLFMKEPYTEWLKKEFARLKDFLAVALKGANVEMAHVILQDGGEVKDGVLADLGPEVWEEFQIKFIDENK